MPEAFLQTEKMRVFLTEAVKHYEKRAPAWFITWLDELYIRLQENWQGITLDELCTVAMLYVDGCWAYEAYAVNNAYKLFDRLGRDTSGIAGY